MIPAKKEEKAIPSWLQRASMMFDRDTHQDGDMLSHSWIRFALDVPEPKKLADVEDIQWMMLTRFDAFRDWLLIDRKIALQSVRGQGYRIIPPSEQARIAVEEAMKMVKKGLEKGDKLMVNTRTSELSSDEAKLHTDAHIRLCGIGDMMRRQKKDVFRLFLHGPG